MDHEEAEPDDGIPGGAGVKKQKCHLCHQLLDSEAELQASVQELQTLRTQQAHEMQEVESYVAHIRGLLEERESLTADYGRDNEHLRQELHQIRQQQESQSKELTEMLAQEDLGEIGLSSPSEQVAYLLVERATLLERLEAVERRLESQSLTENLREVHHQTHSEEISQEKNERQRLERDLEEASRRLAMAHQDIRRLTNELEAAKNRNLDPTDMIKLQHAKEQNDRLDAENRALRERVHSLDSDKRSLQDQLDVNGVKQDDPMNKSISNEQQIIRQPGMLDQEKDCIHKRCREAREDRLVQVKELQRQLQRLRKEQEELEERNEELEALLGEAQNVSKEERHRHEGELEGLQRRIKGLEAELKKHGASDKLLKNGNAKTPESFSQLHMSDNSQERLALLEARLTEEKDWRKQLEVDLSAAQDALKKDREALQIGERELKKLRLEVNSLQTECQQGKTLIKSLTQVKGEKAVLEEKVAQMERAQNRLKSELEQYKASNQTKGDLKDNRLQVDQLQDQADRLLSELSSLQTAHNTLREEMAAERRQTAELQAKLIPRVQESLTAEGERDSLKLEVQRLKEQLNWHKEQLSFSKEALVVKKEPELHTARVESGLSLLERANNENLDQDSHMKQELNHLQNKLEEERRLASHHQLAIQAQFSEAQAHIKSQDLVLGQKAMEAKQMKQDLQRAQSLFTSAERELRYEKEKNMDLKRHNTLLEQEKLKLRAELKQVQTKFVQVEQSIHTQTAECERHQQTVRELELELARNSTNRSTTTSLQEELQVERARLIAADKKVLELQQQIKSAQHQLRVEEARAGESSRLERDSRDLTDTIAALRAMQQEEHITRKLLEQREEELQQQVRSLRLKEASMTRANAELSHQAQQLDTRLNILGPELSKAREELRDSQKLCNKLQEELGSSQQECDRIKGELQQVLLQLDTHIRKYNEKQSQHKSKLRQAKQVFLKATTQRDRIIQKLENDLVLASSLSLKEKERIKTVTEENEKLLEEKRELLQKISEAEEIGSSGMRTASTVQYRVNVLEVENRQLQDRTLKLSNQVSSLERALRNVQSYYSVENAKKELSSESICEGLLHTYQLSLTSGSCDPLDILDAICRLKVGDRVMVNNSPASVSTHFPSEQGYLNLTSPLVPPDTKGTEEGTNDADQV